jgi:hypothetical protein
MTFWIGLAKPPGVYQFRPYPAHPEVILFSPGQFETCPPWVPGMDSGERFARIAEKTIPVHRFDHRANWAAKVRNVSRLGSQLFNLLRTFDSQ